MNTTTKAQRINKRQDEIWEKAKSLTNPPKARRQAIRGRKALDDAPDWFGCGRTITQESWDQFTTAYREYYAKQDRERGLSP